jgi:hypothetical protein
MEALAAFLASDAGTAVKGALVAAFLDFATGSFAALKDGTFTLDAVAAFLRKHILGRVAPLAALLAGAYVSGDTLLMGFAIAGLTAYAAETVASVKGNLIPPKSEILPPLTPEQEAAGLHQFSVEVNPVPQD